MSKRSRIKNLCLVFGILTMLSTTSCRRATTPVTGSCTSNGYVTLTISGVTYNFDCYIAEDPAASGGVGVTYHLSSNSNSTIGFEINPLSGVQAGAVINPALGGSTTATFAMDGGSQNYSDLGCIFTINTVSSSWIRHH
jgi:hypothetical protein